MPHEHHADFSHPWCLALFRSPTWHARPSPSRHPSPSSSSNSLIAQTLHSPSAIRAVQTFHRLVPNSSTSPIPGAAGSCAPIPSASDPSAASPSISASAPPNTIAEVRQLVSLGSGMDGIAGVCHGGIVATLLDEVMVEMAEGGLGRGIITGGLRVEFRRKVSTPGVVLCRAWREGNGDGERKEEEERKGVGDGNSERDKGRRKVWIVGTVEDGEGGVFARGEGWFVRRREGL